MKATILEQGAPFKYSALVEIMPEILLNDYTGFEVSKEKFVLNPDNIEGEIERMQENMAQLIPLDEDAVESPAIRYPLTTRSAWKVSRKRTALPRTPSLKLGTDRMFPDSRSSWSA